ncbi:hypothetical protein [Empedobacter brevis]|uniref:hypothetical protein n=1 Tax=Empedobacter brevis TaxID=247 RepID=UPI0033423547
MGASQTLSKIKPLIKEFELIYDMATHSSIHEVGTRKVITLYFDMNKAPLTKKLLSDHINALIMN